MVALVVVAVVSVLGVAGFGTVVCCIIVLLQCCASVAGPGSWLVLGSVPSIDRGRGGLLLWAACWMRFRQCSTKRLQSPPIAELAL